jgi:hypothetical protein
LAPASADVLVLGVGVGVPLSDGVGDAELGEGDPPVGDGDALWLGDLVGDADEEGPGVRHAMLELDEADGACDPPGPWLGNGELELPLKPLCPLGPPPLDGPCCWLVPL